jgi:UDP-glucose 4-epimerase
MTDRILITGASGFVGAALVRALAAEGRRVRAGMRQPASFGVGVENVVMPDIGRPADWARLLDGVHSVVHLAGVAHAGSGIADEVYERINHVASAGLAAAAASAGVRRLVFMSSILAQSGPSADRVLRESDPPRPTGAYGRSKLAAEKAIRASGVPFTILRPVLIYGPGAKGNLATLVRLARLPLPLPFGALTARRSLLGRDNLIAAVRLALDAAEAADETFVVADPEPLTIADMLRAIRAGLGRPRRLFNAPPRAFAVVLKALGRADLWDRLGGPLVADPAKLIAAGWRPATDTAGGLAAMVASQHGRRA